MAKPPRRPETPAPTQGVPLALLVLAAVGAGGYWRSARAPGPAAAPTGFQAARAFADLEAITARGARWYGAPGRDAAREELEKLFLASGCRVVRHAFTIPHPESKAPMTLTNVLARLAPDLPRRVLLGTHWDTRLWAENDPDPARRAAPIPGANDGASGVAVLAELARALAAKPLAKLGVDFALFDGEEYGRPDTLDNCKGSNAFAAELARFYPGSRPEAGIVLDMVGERGLAIRREDWSQGRVAWLCDALWAVAARRGATAFQDGKAGGIDDDHYPLQQAGVPAVLLIDYQYPEWHTSADTPARCAPESLEAVGSVVLETLRDYDAGRF